MGRVDKQKEMAGKVRAEIVRPIERRIKKLETAQRRQKSVFVVSGYSDEEHQRQIDEAIACGKAAPDSLFVCIKKFPFKDHSDPKPDDREGQAGSGRAASLTHRGGGGSASPAAGGDRGPPAAHRRSAGTG